MNNAEIIASLRNGEHHAALKELYQSYPTVRHFIRQNGGSEDDARDVFQEALMVFFRKCQDNSFELSSSLGTYLYSICKYKWKDQLIKKNREVSADLSALQSEDIAYDEEKELRLNAMEKVVQLLGEKCREVLTRFYYKKESMEDIADDLGYSSIDSVKTQKYKCLERARNMIREQSFIQH